MAQTQENAFRANLAASKAQGKKQDKPPKRFNRVSSNSGGDARSRLAKAKSAESNIQQRVQKTQKALGVNRHKDAAQRLRGWGGGAVGGVIGSAIPFVGNVAGAWIGRTIGNSIIGKWILIILVFLLVASLFAVTLLTIGSIMIICEEWSDWALWGSSFVNDQASMMYSVCESLE